MLNKLEALKYKNFLVITISDILKIQLEDIIRRHRLLFDVDVHTGDDFDKILDKYDFIVIDEADKFSEKNVVNFRSNPLKKRFVFCGISNLIGKNCLMCSATFAELE